MTFFRFQAVDYLKSIALILFLDSQEPFSVFHWSKRLNLDLLHSQLAVNRFTVSRPQGICSL